jgi:hypothetical protein
MVLVEKTANDRKQVLRRAAFLLRRWCVKLGTFVTLVLKVQLSASASPRLDSSSASIHHVALESRFNKVLHFAPRDCSVTHCA